MTRDPRQTVLLTYDRLCTFEFGIMVELFGLPRPEFDNWYSLRIAAVDDGPMHATGGLRVEAPYTMRVLDSAGTILIPGWRRPLSDVPTALVRKLRRAHDDGARILSVCSGVFVLAAAGLIDGKRATTHWLYADELAAAYPNVEVDPDVLYVDEGQVLSSAGSAAGIDMGLHLIRRDHGSEVANAIARRLVVPPHRDGGQRQFIDAPVDVTERGDSFAEWLDRLREAVRTPHTVTSMARSARMSERTFARRFRSATGTTPHRWLSIERVRAAQLLLETTDLSLEHIADRVGFGDAQLLRLHFRRQVGTSPSAYRKTFHAR